MRLPEQWRFRTNWRGKVILQRRWRKPGYFPGDWVYFWEDAGVEDLQVFFEETT